MKILGLNFGEKKRSEIAFNQAMTHLAHKKSLALDDFLESFNATKGGFKKINIRDMFRYYECCSPLFTAVRMIAREGATVVPVLQEKETGDFVKNHDLLTFLETPNGMQTAVKFYREYISFDLLTGNTFLNANGAVNKPPLELFNISPENVDGEMDLDGFPKKYTVTPHGGSKSFMFDRKEDLSTEGVRYFNSSADKELWHAKQFDPHQDLFGLSPLTALFFDIEQWISASNHNMNLLENGGRLSLALIPKGVLTQSQQDGLSHQLNTNHTGSSNAGRALVMEGIADVKDLGQSNKDLDFSSGISRVSQQIYTTLNIPLPLISPEHQNFANFTFANIALYKNAILPQISDMFAEIGRLLLPRYPDGDQFNLTFIESDIPALRQLEVDAAMTLKNIGVSTTNEIRAKLGLDEVDGGDEVFIPSGVVPLADDMFTDNNLGLPRVSEGTGDVGKMFAKDNQLHYIQTGDKLIFKNDEAYQKFIELITDQNGNLMLDSKAIHEILKLGEEEKEKQDAA